MLLSSKQKMCVATAATRHTGRNWLRTTYQL